MSSFSLELFSACSPELGGGGGWSVRCTVQRTVSNIFAISHSYSMRKDSGLNMTAAEVLVLPTVTDLFKIIKLSPLCPMKIACRKYFISVSD